MHFCQLQGKTRSSARSCHPPREISPHLGQQGLNPVVCSIEGRAASESQGFERWRWACMVTGMTDPQTDGLKSFFPLLEPSPEAMLLTQVSPWCPKRTPFVLQPWSTSQLGEGSSLHKGASPQPCACCVPGKKGFISASRSPLC